MRLLVPWQVSLMDKIKFLQSCNLGSSSSFSKMLHHSFYILSIKCKPKDFLSISWRYRTIDPQNGCHVGNGIYVLTFMSLNEIGTWVRATIGLPSWIFFCTHSLQECSRFQAFLTTHLWESIFQTLLLMQEEWLQSLGYFFRLFLDQFSWASDLFHLPAHCLVSEQS